MDLSSSEIRVLGCLLEKQRTTPDHYPLTLNALRLACNQSTNREPVLNYDDAVIRDALHRLERRGYTRLASGRSSRSPKYRHLLSEALPMGDGEQAVMCVLMLRGPQTPGELKQRTERMHPFVGLEAVNDTLDTLIDRRLVRRLERRPGQKEERYTQLLGEDAPALAPGAPEPSHVYSERMISTPSAAPTPALANPAPASPVVAERDLLERVRSLELHVAELRQALSELRGEELRSEELQGGELRGEPTHAEPDWQHEVAQHTP